MLLCLVFALPCESTPPPLTHADWLCYSKRFPHVAERFGLKTLAIRRFFYSKGKQLGHELDRDVRCDESFTFKAPDWSELQHYVKRKDDRRDCRGRKFGDLYEQFQEQGYTVFTPCSLDTDKEVLDQLAAFTRSGGRERQLNAHNHLVLYAATDPDTHEMLSFLHSDRKPWPFQTLNFKYGTAQPTHSDLAHFDTLPTRGLMAAAWLALEDIDATSGPLVVYPGSHRLGLWDFAQLGITPDMPRNAELVNETSYPLYEAKLRDEIAKRKMSAEVLNGVKKGDLVIWANSLLHGGSQVLNNSMTRLSQVTHFFFEPTEIAWSPRLSPEDRHLHRRSPETWAALAQASKLRMTNPMALHAGHMQEGMTTPGRRATAALRGF